MIRVQDQSVGRPRHVIRLLFLTLTLVAAPVLGTRIRVNAQQALGGNAQQQLEPGKPVERPIADGERHAFSLRLEAGEFVHIFVYQRGVTVAVTLVGPDGKNLFETANPGSTQEPKWLSHIAESSGDFRIEVRVLQRQESPNSYTITLSERRRAMRQDEDRMIALQAFLEASRSYAEKVPQSYRKAIEKCKEALALYRKTGRQVEEAAVLNSIARAYSAVSEYKSGIEFHEQALQAYRQLKDRPSEGLTQIALGGAYFAINQYEEANRHYEQALLVLREVGHRTDEGRTLNNLGTSYLRLSRYKNAIEHYEQALAISREVKDRGTEGRALNNLGIAYRSLSQYDKAIEYFEQALVIKHEEKDRVGEGGTLNNLGNAYLSLSRYEKAIEYYEQALPIRREVKDRVGEGLTLNNLGVAYESLSRYEQAIGCYESALAISREVKDRAGESRALNNLGNAYRALGRDQKAIEYYEQALTLNRDARDRDGSARVLNNLGTAYKALSKYEKAIEYYEQALAIFREVKDRAGESGVLTNLGLANVSLNRHEKGIEYYEQALAIKREVKDRAGEARAINALGNAYYLLSRYERATEYYEQALTIFREVKNRHEEAIALDSLMLVWERQSSLHVAILFGKQAVNIYQNIRGNLRNLDQESRQSFLRSNEDTYRKLADLLISRGRLAEAEKVLELLKEEEFNRVRRRNGPKDPEIGLTKTEAEAAKISDELALLASERGSLLAKIENQTATSQDRQRLDLIEARITDANKKIKLVLAEVAKVSPDDRMMTQQSQAMMQSLRRLGAGTVALYTVVTAEKGWVILTTADFRRAYPINTTNLNQSISDFRLTLKSDRYDPVPLAQKLYAALFLQKNDDGVTLAADLKSYRARTLMWSLDGVLRYIPVGALHDGKGYLIERYPNLVFTTASLTRLLDAAEREWRGIGLGVSREHKDFEALPAVARELRAIIRETAASQSRGVLPGVIRLDEQFTRRAMLDGLREGYPVVHIASHFRFNAEREELSFLLLGDGSYLSLEEMQNSPGIFEKVELLTLSACDTATIGANGKEIEGFAFVAQDLGAKSVVASLWPVTDEGTEVLMREFYRLKQKNPQWSKAEALRQAQMALLKSNVSSRRAMEEKRGPVANEGDTGMKPYNRDAKTPFAHPHYWAPFILIGNWK